MGFKLSIVPRIKLGIDLFDKLMIDGLPSNSLVIFSGEAGIAKSSIFHCMTSKLLQNKYACIYMCVDEHPISVYENMILYSPKIKKYLKKNQLLLIDLFSYKLNIQNNNDELQNSIISFYPTGWQNLFNMLIQSLNNLMIKYKKAIVMIDSLTELLYKMDPNSILDLIKVIRLEICKRRYIPVFASSHFGIKSFEEFEQVIEYHVDGIIDFRYDPLAMQYGSLIKQLRIRKLRGCKHDKRWHSFDILNNDLVEIQVENLTQKVGSLNINI
ncbi:MAG: RAD55 family ATPase [Thermoproteota archaeon]|nr:RAD55 family ATPase [Thermoproteota archaeon]